MIFARGVRPACIGFRSTAIKLRSTSLVKARWRQERVPLLGIAMAHEEAALVIHEQLVQFSRDRAGHTETDSSTLDNACQTPRPSLAMNSALEPHQSARSAARRYPLLSARRGRKARARRPRSVVLPAPARAARRWGRPPPPRDPARKSRRCQRRKIAGTLDVLQKLGELGGEGWHAIAPCCQGEFRTIISADPGQFVHPEVFLSDDWPCP
jgi:hypothetical protein